MSEKLTFIQSKIYSIEQLSKIKNVWKFHGLKIVFTNGCFDLLHAGHATYLAQAAALGNKLIVGLNSDESVKKLNKGKGRPIQSEDDRALILASFYCVDAVVIFKEDNPEEIIKIIEPDVLVKGGDWKTEEIAGSKFVTARGGTVVSLPFLEDRSTTLIESKIRKADIP